MRVAAGSTDQSVVIRIVDSADGTPEEGVTSASGGIALWYWRMGSTVTAITESDLAAIDSAHSDGGMKHADDGYYRVDIPDAAFATGAARVTIGGTVTGMVVIGTVVEIGPVVTSALDAAGVRTAIGLGSANLDTQLGDLPTNAELTNALAAADDAVLTAVATRASQTSVDDVPTVAEILAGVVEGAITLKGALRLMLAVLAGESTGGGTTTVTFRDVADAKARVTATVTADGNRTAITRDITD